MLWIGKTTAKDLVEVHKVTGYKTAPLVNIILGKRHARCEVCRLEVYLFYGYLIGLVTTRPDNKICLLDELQLLSWCCSLNQLNSFLSAIDYVGVQLLRVAT